MSRLIRWWFFIKRGNYQYVIENIWTHIVESGIGCKQYIKRNGVLAFLIRILLLSGNFIIKFVIDFPLAKIIIHRGIARNELKQIADGSVWTIERDLSEVDIESPAFRDPYPPDSSDIPGHIDRSPGYTFSLEEEYICEIDDASVLGPYICGSTTNGKVIQETVCRSNVAVGTQLRDVIQYTIRSRGYLSAINTFLNPYHRFAEDQYDTEINRAMILEPASFHNNFGHWMSQHLLKIRLLKHYERKTGNNVTLILAPNPPRYKLEYLKLAGYGPEDWIEWDHDIIKVNTLIVPTFPTYSPEAVNWLRKLVLSDVDVEGDYDFSEHVYVSRRDAPKRHVVNEEEVIDTIKEYGFEAYALSELSIIEQAALFNNAKIIIAPEGSGLHNLVFAQGDVSVLELVVQYGLEWYKLSEMLGFNHEYFYVEGKEGIGNPNMRIDVSRLEKEMQEKLSV